MKKICLAASSGGHFEQIMMLKPLIDEYDGFLITEKTKYEISTKNIRAYYVKQINRKEIAFVFKFIINAVIAFKIFIKEKPDIVISTGALSTIPICIISKFFRRKLIFIESFAKTNSPTLTGKLLYKFADKFYVQWEDMKKIYPKAICEGGIY